MLKILSICMLLQFIFSNEKIYRDNTLLFSLYKEINPLEINSDLNRTNDVELNDFLLNHDIIKSINLEEDRFGFEPEITAKISKLNLRVYEVGISYYGRTYEEGKKIGFRDAFRALYSIIRYNCFS